VGADGSTVGRGTLPSPVGVVAAAGRLWYVDSANHLRTLGVDGRAADMGVLQSLAASGPGSAGGLAVSADGRRWAWGVCSGCSGSGARTRVYLGGIDTPEKLVADESTTNQVLIPVAYTSRGVVVVRSASGLGGCCYLSPEDGHTAVLVVSPGALQPGPTLPSCVTAYASEAGSFACVGRMVTVHLADGSTRAVMPTQPVAQVGWARVDDAGARVVFTVLHSRGQGDGGCPCNLDTEAGSLSDGSVTKLADQMTLDDLLPDGRIVATSAPALPGEGPTVDFIVSPDGTRMRLGPDGESFLAVVPMA